MERKNGGILRTFLCLLTALMVLFAFSGCGDTSDNEKTDSSSDTSTTDSSGSSTDSSSSGVTKSGSGDDLSLGLGNGDTYVSREDYTLLGDYYYVEAYRIETSDGDMTELGIDFYLTYSDEDGYTDADGVLAVYYDAETGEVTSYEAYVGTNPVRAMVTYRVGTNATYFTCTCFDDNYVMTGSIWDNYILDEETGVATYYAGKETYSESGVLESMREERYTVSDDGTLTIYEVETKEYDEDGNLTLDETVEYDEDGDEIAS